MDVSKILLGLLVLALLFLVTRCMRGNDKYNITVQELLNKICNLEAEIKELKQENIELREELSRHEQ